ncbi:TBC1 domain family member 5-like [Halichondria panicea]|uniref:TBC1 domain family member 5-like n=1 Tax=Halichondria panicea TaxID=6063 RepID=UPI00312B9C15
MAVESLEESWALIVGMEESRESPNVAISDGNNIREDWNEASRLLYQSGYFKVVKEMALSGQLQQYNIRSVCWRLFLGCLPEDQNKWEEAVKKARDVFTTIKTKHIIDPHKLASGKNLAVHNPLSLEDDSPWNRYFQDNELRQMINQDVVRTFPDVQFFKQPHIQKMLVDLLFCFSRENEELSYRQGMHEILAPIVFVLHAEMRDLNDPTLAPAVLSVMDPRFIEHDAYTIFAELMESMGSWYMSTALEADYYKARAQHKKKMSHDPRTNKPFQGMADLSPMSAISRKLGVIHNLHLKNADEQLYTHLKELSIPPQTYGIRWIRLLFGREFPLPSVLELWDALLADGPSLGLVDYMCVAMLMHMRDVLTGGDYSTCMQYLMHFPPVYEVNYLVQRALHLRNPSVYPSPRIWSHNPAAQATYSLGSTLPLSSSTDTNSQQHSVQHRSHKVSSVKQVIKHTAARMSRPVSSAPRLEFHGKSRSRSPSPVNHTPINHPLQMPDDVPSKKGRGRVIGSMKKDLVKSTSKEMRENPKSSPFTGVSSSKLDKLSNRIDDLQAKCLYCGGKADSFIASLQTEIVKLEGLSPETENTILLSLAGLKQVRDLLLNKIPFSGELAPGWENVQGSRSNLEDSHDSSDGSSTNLDSFTLSKLASKSSPLSDNDAVSKDSTRTNNIDHPLQRSLEVGTEVLADEGVPSRDTHPLLNSGD